MKLALSAADSLVLAKILPKAAFKEANLLSISDKALVLTEASLWLLFKPGELVALV